MFRNSPREFDFDLYNFKNFSPSASIYFFLTSFSLNVLKSFLNLTWFWKSLSPLTLPFLYTADGVLHLFMLWASSKTSKVYLLYYFSVFGCQSTGKAVGFSWFLKPLFFKISGAKLVRSTRKSLSSSTTTVSFLHNELRTVLTIIVSGSLSACRTE